MPSMRLSALAIITTQLVRHLSRPGAREVRLAQEAQAMTQTHRRTPKGWTAETCPKGHSRDEHEYLSGKQEITRCRECDRENVAKRAAEIGKTGVGLSVDKIPLMCGCTVLYRKGIYTKGADPLFCFRHDGWFPQW